MQEFLYVFGYEDPINYEVNNRLGTDYESSNLIRIFAGSENQAKLWGDTLATNFVEYLFKKEGFNDESWKSSAHFGWIEKNPDEYISQNWEHILKVDDGEYPDFEKWDNTFLD